MTCCYRAVQTISGDLLNLYTSNTGQLIGASFGNSSVFFKSHTGVKETESCKEGSLIIQVSDILRYDDGLSRILSNNSPLSDDFHSSYIGCRTHSESFVRRGLCQFESHFWRDFTIRHNSSIKHKRIPKLNQPTIKHEPLNQGTRDPWTGEDDIPTMMIYIPAFLLIGAFLYIHCMKVATARVRRLHPAMPAGKVLQGAEILVPKVRFQPSWTWSLVP